MHFRKSQEFFYLAAAYFHLIDPGLVPKVGWLQLTIFEDSDRSENQQSLWISFISRVACGPPKLITTLKCVYKCVCVWLPFIFSCLIYWLKISRCEGPRICVFNNFLEWFLWTLKFENHLYNDTAKKPLPVYFAHIIQMSETDVIFLGEEEENTLICLVIYRFTHLFISFIYSFIDSFTMNIRQWLRHNVATWKCVASIFTDRICSSGIICGCQMMNWQLILPAVEQRSTAGREAHRHLHPWAFCRFLLNDSKLKES